MRHAQRAEESLLFPPSWLFSVGFGILGLEIWGD